MKKILIELSKEFNFTFDKSKNEIFNYFMSLRGEVYRAQPGRETLKFSINNKNYFIKKHFGIGWREIFKNIFSFRAPIINADNEYFAIEHLSKAGVHVAAAKAYGKKGCNPATQHSFLVMDAVEDSISLEDYCNNWKVYPPAFNIKIKIVNEVAKLARTMHQSGVNHRDFYICHFLLKRNSETKQPTIFIIDLHRAAIRVKVPKRWLIKDLSSLYFSIMNIGLTERDIIRFLKVYFSLSWRQIHSQYSDMLKLCEQKAWQLYQKEFSKPPSVKRYF